MISQMTPRPPKSPKLQPVLGALSAAEESTLLAPLDINLPDLPDDLAHISSYVQRAVELRSQDPIMAYWCLHFVTKQGLGVINSENRPFLLALIEWLDKTKKDLSHIDSVVNDAAGAKYIETVAKRVLKMADDEDRAGTTPKSAARRYLAASNFLDVLQFYKTQNPEEIQELARYAKYKTSALAKLIRETSEDDDKPSSRPTSQKPSPLPFPIPLPQASVVSTPAQGQTRATTSSFSRSTGSNPVPSRRSPVSSAASKPPVELTIGRISLLPAESKSTPKALAAVSNYLAPGEWKRGATKAEGSNELPKTSADPKTLRRRRASISSGNEAEVSSLAALDGEGASADRAAAYRRRRATSISMPSPLGLSSSSTSPPTTGPKPPPPTASKTDVFSRALPPRDDRPAAPPLITDKKPTPLPSALSRVDALKKAVRFTPSVKGGLSSVASISPPPPPFRPLPTPRRIVEIPLPSSSETTDTSDSDEILKDESRPRDFKAPEPEDLTPTQTQAKGSSNIVDGLGGFFVVPPPAKVVAVPAASSSAQVRSSQFATSKQLAATVKASPPVTVSSALVLPGPIPAVTEQTPSVKRDRLDTVTDRKIPSPPATSTPVSLPPAQKSSNTSNTFSHGRSQSLGGGAKATLGFSPAVTQSSKTSPPSPPSRGTVVSSSQPGTKFSAPPASRTSLDARSAEAAKTQIITADKENGAPFNTKSKDSPASASTTPTGPNAVHTSGPASSGTAKLRAYPPTPYPTPAPALATSSTSLSSDEGVTRDLLDEVTSPSSIGSAAGLLSPETIATARKFTTYAMAALQFDDTETARGHLLAALAALENTSTPPPSILTSDKSRNA